MRVHLGPRNGTIARYTSRIRALQLVHSNKPPFTAIAAEYARFFEGTGIELRTEFLSGRDSLGLELGGLKRAAIRTVRELAEGCAFVIAQRYKPVYIAGHLPGMPVLGVHHQTGDYDRWHRRRFVRRRADRISLIGVSDSVRDDLRAALPGVDVRTLHHAYEPGPLLDRGEARALLGLDDGAWLGCVARLHPVKDHETLFRAVARTGDRLALVGSGPLEPHLRELAADLGITVRFCGEVPDAARLYRAFDRFVLASKREGFGIVLLEAMAAGLPIVASDALAEIVGDAGRLFPVGDADALADALRAQPVSNPGRIELFSPAAIRGRFWALPFCAPFVGKTAFVDNARAHGD
ncbi:MAG: glycosyltransferase [Planctomycetota bacterium]